MGIPGFCSARKRGRRGAECIRLPALLVFLSCVGLGPAWSSDISQPGRTQGCLMGQPCTDPEALQTQRHAPRTFCGKLPPGQGTLVGARSLPGQEPPPPPAKALPLRHMMSSPYLSIFRDPPPWSTLQSCKRKTLYFLLTACGVRLGVIPTLRNTPLSISSLDWRVGKGELVFPK